MRVAILTPWWASDNYGQLLQCYALQRYLRDQGHDAYLIRYKPSGAGARPTPLAQRLLKALNPVLLYRFIKGLLAAKKRARLAALADKEEALHNRHFDDFRKEYIAMSPRIYNSYAELCSDPPQADCYIVGSDQVWVFASDKDSCATWFLGFGPQEVKRLSYAASWGRDSIPDEIAAEIAPLLKRFAYVSVREKSGVELCKLCGRADAKWVRDPTLLLSAESWRGLYTKNNAQKPSGKYIFVYMIAHSSSDSHSKECDFDMESLYRFAHSRSLDVVLVTGNRAANRYVEHKKTFPTIPEWLALVDGAEYVITNSFHGCAFSMIFAKRFAAVPLKGGLVRLNSRLESLFELFGVAPRYLSASNDFSAMEAPVNWKDLIDMEFNLEDVLNEGKN